jgi:ribosome biogenesis protein MAK21
MLLIQSLLSCAPTVKSQSSGESKSGSTLAATSNIQLRFLRTLYASLHDPRLRTSSKKPQYLNLLLKTMNHPYRSSSALAIDLNSDLKIRRAFWRRLIAVALSGTGMGGENEVVCGCLYILGEVQSRAKELRNIGKEVPNNSGKGAKDKTEDEYDPRKREPEFARADATPIWELTTLSNHYHPSVSLHAQQLLGGRPVTANADLSLNTLSHFLDR